MFRDKNRSKAPDSELLGSSSTQINKHVHCLCAVCEVMLQEPGKLTARGNTQECLSSGSLHPTGKMRIMS